MKIVVITGRKVREKTLKAFGYKYLKEKNYEVWDASSCVNIRENNLEYPDEVETKKKIYKVESIKKLKKKFQRKNPNSFIQNC